MFNHNQFTTETHEEHLQRCQLCAAGVVTYNAILAFRPPWITDIADLNANTLPADSSRK